MESLRCRDHQPMTTLDRRPTVAETIQDSTVMLKAAAHELLLTKPHLEAVHVGRIRLDRLHHQIQRAHLFLDGLYDGHSGDIALGVHTDRLPSTGASFPGRIQPLLHP